MSETFSKSELILIHTAKRALTIVAKVIRDKDAKEVVKDQDLAESIGNKSPEEALADEELGKKIRERVTPDLPQLNAEQEALVISQLGSAVFGRLLEENSNDDNGPN